jgi:kojibiose phosphorylase
MEINGVIFDLDGVIVDTAEHHYLAWKRLASELGIPCPPDRKDQVRGVSRRRSLEIVLDGHQVSEEEAEELMARKDAYYQQLIQSLGPQDILPGVQDLLVDLRKKNVKIAVATVSKNAQEVLERLGVREAIDVLVDGHSGARSKPEPDLFLYAARGLGVPPSECLVIEDAPAGIEGAEVAGMYTVALGPQDRFTPVRPDLILPSLAGASHDGLIELLGKQLEATRVWQVEEPRFNPACQRWFESLGTVGNGYLGTRATLEEGYPGELRATLAYGVFDNVPIFGSGLINLPDWTAVHLVVDGTRFSLQEGSTALHLRALDMRDGRLRRRVRWQSPKGKTVEVHTTRFASMADPHLCVQTYAVTSRDFDGPVELWTTLSSSPENPGLPPAPSVGLLHWRPVSQGAGEGGAVFLQLRSRESGIGVGMAMAVEAAGIPEATVEPRQCPGQVGIVLRTRLHPGQTLVLTKLVTLYTSHEEAAPQEAALRHLAEARGQGLHQILRSHRASWAETWRDCDVGISGDETSQRAVRFNLYHLLIAGPRKEGSIPAKALTGFGYRGHVFWDTDIFMLPFFTFTQPNVARRMLTYRYHTLPGARENARKNGFRGAMYAWESAQDGRETTPRWVPREDGTLTSILTGEREHHITADVSYAVWQYWQATGDDDFMRDCGAEIVLSTAQFWASRVEEDTGKYVIRHVIGPDEYHEDVNDNAYTNWMARWNLQAAAATWRWLWANHPDVIRSLTDKLQLTQAEVESWENIAQRIFIPSRMDGLIEQFRGYLKHEDIDLQSLEPRSRSVRDVLGADRTNRSQVLKQPDVLMLFHLFPDAFTQEQLQVNFDYYEPKTDNSFGSSLGPAIHASLAARLGELEKAYEHFRRAALVDIEDLRGNTEDGIHAASAGGVWQAVAFGFAGIRLTPEGPVAYPRLPKGWQRLTLSIRWRGKRYVFDLKPSEKGPVQPKGP